MSLHFRHVKTKALRPERYPQRKIEFAASSQITSAAMTHQHVPFPACRKRKVLTHTHTQKHWHTHTWDLPAMSVVYCQPLSSSAGAVGGSVPCSRAFSAVDVVVVIMWQKCAFHSLPSLRVHSVCFLTTFSFRDCNQWSSGHKLWTFRLQPPSWSLPGAVWNYATSNLKMISTRSTHGWFFQDMQMINFVLFQSRWKMLTRFLQGSEIQRQRICIRHRFLKLLWIHLIL